LYGYGFGDPVNLSDRSGQIPKWLRNLIGIVGEEIGGDVTTVGGISPLLPLRVFTLGIGILRFIDGLFGPGPNPTVSSQGAPPVGTEIEFQNMAQRAERVYTAHTPTVGPPIGLPPVAPPGPPPGGGSRRGPVPTEPGGWTASAGSAVDAIGFLTNFALGIGPDDIYLFDDSPQAADMFGAPGVANARALFSAGGCSGVSNFDASFGLIGGAPPGWSVRGPGGSYLVGQDGQFSAALFNPSLLLFPTRQLMGTYKINIQNAGNGLAQVSLFNPMSTTSAFLHFPRARSSGMFRTIRFHITWVEALPQGCGR